MIWYRHWLELRTTALMLTSAAAALGPLYFRSELFDPRPAFQPHPIFGPLQSLTSSLDVQQFTAVGRHVEFMWFAVLCGSLFLAGDGLRTFSNQFGRTGLVTTTAQYTLSLPISRRRVVTTRLLAGYAIACIALTVSLLANTAALLMLDRSVPLVPMFLATGVGTTVILFWMCVNVVMMVSAGAVWGMSLTVIAMLLSSPLAFHAMSVAAARTPGLRALLLIAGAALAGAILLAVNVASGEEV